MWFVAERTFADDDSDVRRYRPELSTMAAATSGESPVRQIDPCPSDRVKCIEAKVVILGSQGKRPPNVAKFVCVCVCAMGWVVTKPHFTPDTNVRECNVFVASHEGYVLDAHLYGCVWS